jgi:perosamine synthetase
MTSKVRRLLVDMQKTPYFGFIQGHDYLASGDLDKIQQWVGKDNLAIIEEFEQGFARIVGEDGRTVSFASGRMGFYALMKIEGIGVGDEVVLQGATCSVMVNAVLRIGASPIYADIDPDTFGSSALAIEKVLTLKTKMIVAQHSFGIPCDIQPIVELAKIKGIFLLEDCALTLGSNIDGVVCGNFGDAALFSTDHSKPLNTLTGGLIYTQKISLFKQLQAIQKDSASLSKEKQKALWQQLLYERKYCRPDRYGRMQLITAFRSKLKVNENPFLDEDFGTNTSTNTTYPYPAKLPSFLAALGLQEIKLWEETAKLRKELLQKLLNIIGDNSNQGIPSAYFDSSKSIIPLRLAWAPKNGDNFRRKLSNFICTSWTWFMQPVVATTEPLDEFCYKKGDCPVSEKLGPSMVNLPCNLSSGWSKVLYEQLENSDIIWH